jgi:hypothetical protein
MAVLALYRCGLSYWYKPKKDKVKMQQLELQLWLYSAACSRVPFKRVNYAQYILTHPLISFGH